MVYDNRGLDRHNKPNFQAAERMDVETLRFLDEPRDQRFYNSSKERGWDSRAGITKSRFNDYNIKSRKDYFENLEINPAPAGSIHSRRAHRERAAEFRKDDRNTSWNERAGLTVSRMNEKIYTLNREYFDKPLVVKADATPSNMAGTFYCDYTTGSPLNRSRMLKQNFSSAPNSPKTNRSPRSRPRRDMKSAPVSPINTEPAVTPGKVPEPKSSSRAGTPKTSSRPATPKAEEELAATQKVEETAATPKAGTPRATTPQKADEKAEQAATPRAETPKAEEQPEAAPEPVPQAA